MTINQWSFTLYFLLTFSSLFTNTGVDLAASFSVDALTPLLADKGTQERLKPFLPAVENLSGSEDDIKQTIQSPQFKQVCII